MVKKLRRLQNNFVAGQLDPGMRLRSDIDAYRNGVETLTNFRPLLHGGASRRPGTSYLATLNKKARLAKFVFSESQQYIVAFMESRIDVYSSDGSVDQSITSGVPYTAAQLFEIRWAQTADTMIVVHEAHPIYKLTRTGASSFTWAAFTFEQHTSGAPLNQPYYKYADEGITLTPSGTSGSITVTLSSGYFTSDYVDEIIRYKGKEIMLTGFTSSTVMAGSVRETLAATTADIDWDEPAFSSVKGYPRTARFFQERLLFGGGKSLPDTLFASKIGAFFNFNLGTGLDDEGIQATIGSDQSNTIMHLVASNHLEIFTNESEWYIPTTEANPFAPANISFREQTTFGSLEVPPRKMDGVTLFPDRTGKHIREFTFSDIEQAYSADSVSKLVPDIFGTPVDAEVISGSDDHPEQYCYIINTDGSIAQLNTMRSENVAGWSKWTTRTGDKFISITSIEDDIFFCVQRTINSATVYYLEKLDYNVTLDCAVTKTASATTSWSGLAHLQAASVDVVDNTTTTHAGTYTVSSSAITTTEAYTNIDIGFDYSVTLKDLPIEIGLANGSIMGEMKRVTKVNVALLNSYTVTLGTQVLPIYDVTDDLSAAPATKTGNYEFYVLGYDKLGQVTLTESAPLPLTVLGMEKEVVF